MLSSGLCLQSELQFTCAGAGAVYGIALITEYILTPHLTVYLVVCQDAPFVRHKQAEEIISLCGEFAGVNPYSIARRTSQFSLAASFMLCCDVTPRQCDQRRGKREHKKAQEDNKEVQISAVLFF